MTEGSEHVYRVRVGPGAIRSITETLPTGVAFAVHAFIDGPLRDNPYRVGKALSGPYEGTYSARRGAYRILYTVDEKTSTIKVTAVEHRSDVYRPR